MRLAQQVLLPRSRLVHLAEVFLSGLLGRADRELEERDRETDPLKIPFDFLPDIRELLLDRLPVSEVERAARRMAVAIEQRLGQAADFLALLVDPTVPGKLPLSARGLPFAKIRLKVLRRLGGRYSDQAAKLADTIGRVEQGIASGPAKPVEPTGPTPFRDRFPDGTPGPAMVWLPGGTFTMGDDRSGRDDETPAHPVTLSHFGIGQYPVTFAEYDRFCEATHREKPNDRGWGRGRRPVINVSWDEAQAYCRWLSEQTGQDYRLLTEAQWEYACRAGSDAAYCFGNDEKSLHDYAWYGEDWGKGSTHPVGEKRANAWGLHNLHGNVWEWVQDWYGPYSKKPRHDPSGPKTGSVRVIRGGSWRYGAEGCRSAFRGRSDPGYRVSFLGFRLARTGAWPSDTLTLARQRAAEQSVRAESEVERKPAYRSYEGFRDSLRDGSTAPELVYLPGGTFKMGDLQGKGFEDERPVHEVTLDAFAMGRYPVTVGEFRRFVDATGYQTEAEREGGAWVYDGKQWGQKADAHWRNPSFTQKDAQPVVCISWNDAAAYCAWLSEQTGERYSLPTEAEWEYACRVSSETEYCFGNDEQRLGEYAWYSENSEDKTHPVGQKRANAWGLYDLHGNVWEWVWDWYGPYTKEPQHNPTGPEEGSIRVIRGGSWYNVAGSCRSAIRYRIDPGIRDGHLGFRLARRV